MIKHNLLRILVMGVIFESAANLTAASALGPETLTFAELVLSYRTEVLAPRLQQKLESLLNTPFIENSVVSDKDALPGRSSSALGAFLRIAQWNVGRGVQFEALKLAFTDAAGLRELSKAGSSKRRHTERITEEAEILQRADVVVLTEVDAGVKRTEYRDIAAELASALRMNYAYGVEFIELHAVAEAESSESSDLEPYRYKGLHGTAILSRFPLENVRIIRFEHQGYNWYSGEIKGLPVLEGGKRLLGRGIFRETLSREVRRGGRMALLADISDPTLPCGRATIVATHLEARADSDTRNRQLKELLTAIKEIDHPVILAGDMNTSGNDARPASVTREVKKRLFSKEFWMRQGLKAATNFGLMVDIVGPLLGGSRQQSDPTVRNIPLLSSNPESQFFETLKSFRFIDGGTFDFRGEHGRSWGNHSGTLSNSNQRGEKGFATTYRVKRTIGLAGRFKLDWIFVKPPGLTDPYDAEGPRRFAPHFGRTLIALNYSIKGRISDHNPIVADLPLDDPLQSLTVESLVTDSKIEKLK